MAWVSRLNMQDKLIEDSIAYEPKYSTTSDNEDWGAFILEAHQSFTTNLKRQAITRMVHIHLYFGLTVCPKRKKGSWPVIHLLQVHHPWKRLTNMVRAHLLFRFTCMTPKKKKHRRVLQYSISLQKGFLHYRLFAPFKIMQDKKIAYMEVYT